MSDPCNVTSAQQAAFIPSLLAAPCAASYPRPLTTIVSEWDDVNAVVDYVRALRRVERVSLVGWSRGGDHHVVRQKVFLDLGCTSHMAMWERNHTLLFRASLEWLSQTSVNGAREGMLRLGY